MDATSGAEEGATFPFFSTCFSVVYVVKLHVFTVLVPCCDVDCDFSHLLSREFLFYLCYLYLFKYTNVLVYNTISISDDVRVA